MGCQEGGQAPDLAIVQIRNLTASAVTGSAAEEGTLKMAPLSEKETVELERRVKHADEILTQLERMSEDEVGRSAGFLVELFTQDYLVRWRDLTDQLRTEREEIADYARDHG